MDLCEFQASLIYRVNSRTARATQRKPVLKKQTNKQTNKQKIISANQSRGRPPLQCLCDKHRDLSDHRVWQLSDVEAREASFCLTSLGKHGGVQKGGDSPHVLSRGEGCVSLSSQRP